MAESEKSEEISFFKPRLRFLIPIKNFHCPKKLFNDFKKNKYSFKINNNFSKVVDLCKTVKRKKENTWINDIIANTYKKLHDQGRVIVLNVMKMIILLVDCMDAFRVMFFGESMFSLKTNTSKYCLIYLLAILKRNNFKILDSQFFNPHLVQFGAYEIETKIYEKKLIECLKKTCDFKDLENFQEVLSLIQPTNHKS